MERVEDHPFRRLGETIVVRIKCSVVDPWRIGGVTVEGGVVRAGKEGYLLGRAY